eukprot:gene9065-18777_t
MSWLLAGMGLEGFGPYRGCRREERGGDERGRGCRAFDRSVVAGRKGNDVASTVAYCVFASELTVSDSSDLTDDEALAFDASRIRGVDGLHGAFNNSITRSVESEALTPLYAVEDGVQGIHPRKTYNV